MAPDTGMTKQGSGTGFAMKREPNDKRPHLEMRIVLDRDYRTGEEIKIVGWKKDKLTAQGNVQFSLKVSQPLPTSSQRMGQAAPAKINDDDIPF